MKVSASIELEQALFGYREGHRLLQASRRFEPTIERLLLTLSDMSGPRMVSGFEEYVSGFPIPGKDCYALANTWYAPEMERPGCVWTHVLFVHNDDLRKITNARGLLRSFVHPSKIPPDRYRAPLLLTEHNGTESPGSFSLIDARKLMAALYGTRQRPVLIAAQSSNSFRDLVLNVWSQQWPSLRSGFRFCTGSLSNRAVEGEPFDLQVVPQRLAPELRRETQAFELLEDEGDEQRTDVPEWLDVGSLDLARTASSSFRDFLWRYAEPCGGGRELFRKLAELYLELRPHPEMDLPQVTERVCSTFPSPDCGVVLKGDLYGPHTASSACPPWASEEERLRELATTHLWPAFDPVMLDLRGRASELWRSEPSKGKDLLLEIVEHSSQPLCADVLGGFAKAMTASEACSLAQRRAGLLMGLVARNPSLVTEETFWRGLPLETYQDVLDLLRTDHADVPPPARWIPAVIKGGTEQLAAPVVERFGAKAVLAFLEWFETDTSVTLETVAPAWRAALGTQQDALWSWIKMAQPAPSNRTMALLSGMLDPHGVDIGAVDLDPWLALVKKAPDLPRAFPNAEAFAFLLSLGIRHVDPRAVGLVVESFEYVHAAAADQSFSYRGWRFLESDVPSIYWLSNWDKCERIRRAVLLKFGQARWSFDDFLRCVKKPEILRDMIRSCREVANGETFVLSVADSVISGKTQATGEQEAILRRMVRRKKNGQLKLYF